jgi:hypothetical protein
MAYSKSKLAPCPNGHPHAQWESQGGWHRCFCPLCHATASARQEHFRKWQRTVRASAVRNKDLISLLRKDKPYGDHPQTPQNP